MDRALVPPTREAVVPDAHRPNAIVETARRECVFQRSGYRFTTRKRVKSRSWLESQRRAFLKCLAPRSARNQLGTAGPRRRGPCNVRKDIAKRSSENQLRLNSGNSNAPTST